MVLVAGQRSGRSDGRARRLHRRRSAIRASGRSAISAIFCSTCSFASTSMRPQGSRSSGARKQVAAGSSSSSPPHPVHALHALHAACSAAGTRSRDALSSVLRIAGAHASAIRDAIGEAVIVDSFDEPPASWRPRCPFPWPHSTATCCAARIWSPAARAPSRAAFSRPSARSKSCASASPSANGALERAGGRSGAIRAHHRATRRRRSSSLYVRHSRPGEEPSSASRRSCSAQPMTQQRVARAHGAGQGRNRSRSGGDRRARRPADRSARVDCPTGRREAARRTSPWRNRSGAAGGPRAVRPLAQRAAEARANARRARRAERRRGGRRAPARECRTRPRAARRERASPT